MVSKSGEKISWDFGKVEKEGYVKFNVPLSIETGVKKKKKHYLNLNLYRNMPFHLNNNLKKSMKELVKDAGLTFNFNKFTITYTLYLPDNRLRDISNVCSVVDKYVCDALVENGNMPDDNYQHLPEVLYKIGGVDVDNPRCEVEVHELKET